jgi:dihydroflavonol-4-reductase
MRVAVLGATGLLGQHVCRAALAGGHELRVIHRPASDLGRLEGLRFEAAAADLDDPAALGHALAGIEGVVNCAAPYPRAPRSWREEVRTGLRMLEGFYTACEQARIERIVYLGAAIALRPREDGRPANEQCVYAARPASRNPYVQLKWALDRQAVDAAAGGLPVAIGIPSMSFGEYDWGPSTGQLLLGIASGRLARFVPGKRNVIYAGDAGRGLVSVLEKGRRGQRYLLTGENVTMEDLVTRMASLAGVDTPRPLSLGAARFVSAIQHLRYRLGGPLPVLSETALAVMAGGQYLDGARAARELDFTAVVSVDEALRRSLDWFRGAGYLPALCGRDRHE